MNLLRSLGIAALLLVLAGGQVLADQATESGQQADSSVIRLAPLLPSVVCPWAKSTQTPVQPDPYPRTDKHSVLRLGEKLLLAYAVDRTVNDLASSALGGEGAGKLADALNSFGGRGVVGALGVGYLLGGRRTKRVYGTALEAACEAMVITEGLKFVSGRARPRQPGSDPDDFRGPGSGYTSFPSGHTSNAFALATVLAHEHPKRKWLYYAVAAGVGFARVQKKAHYASDVLAGAVIGSYAGRKAIKGQSLVGKIRGAKEKVIGRDK